MLQDVLNETQLTSMQIAVRMALMKAVDRTQDKDHDRTFDDHNHNMNLADLLNSDCYTVTTPNQLYHSTRLINPLTLEFEYNEERGTEVKKPPIMQDSSDEYSEEQRSSTSDLPCEESKELDYSLLDMTID